MKFKMECEENLEQLNEKLSNYENIKSMIAYTVKRIEQEIVIERYPEEVLKKHRKRLDELIDQESVTGRNIADLLIKLKSKGCKIKIE